MDKAESPLHKPAGGNFSPQNSPSPTSVVQCKVVLRRFLLISEPTLMKYFDIY